MQAGVQAGYADGGRHPWEFIAGGNPKDVLRVNKAVHLLRKLVEKI